MRFAIGMRGIAAALLAFASVSFADAQTPADFYKGKTMRVIIGYEPGGGFDAYARLLADYLPRHLPGSPVIVIATPNTICWKRRTNATAKSASPLPSSASSTSSGNRSASVPIVCPFSSAGGCRGTGLFMGFPLLRGVAAAPRSRRR